MSQTQFQRRGWHAVSNKLAPGDRTADGEFDILIGASSWDKRCVAALPMADVSVRRGILILFDKMDTQGYRKNHDMILQSLYQDKCEHVTLLRGSAVDVEGVWKRIQAHILESRVELRRPLRVLIDSATVPRYHTLAILSVAVKRGLARDVTILYSEGKYPARGKDHEVVFTQGRWRTAPIPGLYGDYRAGAQSCFVVSLGFEGSKTLRIVAREDPEWVTVLLPDPGFEPDYVVRTLDGNRALFERYSVGPTDTIRAEAGDAVAAWGALAGARMSVPAPVNMTYLCSGPKSHSVGCALHALSGGNGVVLYNVPQAHEVVPIEANGVIWRYDITGLFIPAAAAPPRAVKSSVQLDSR